MGEAFLMQKGEVVEPIPPDPLGDDTPYYWEGEEFTSVTGGWGTVNITGTNFTRTKEEDHLYTQAVRSTTNTNVGFVTTNKINLEDVNTLKVELGLERVGGAIGFNGFTLLLTNTVGGSSVASVTQDTATTLNTITLNVSDITGEVYIELRTYAVTYNSSSATSRVYKVWGEA